MSNLLSSLTKIFNLILLLKVAKITGILIGNLLSNRQQKGLSDQIKIKKMKLTEQKIEEILKIRVLIPRESQS